MRDIIVRIAVGSIYFALNFTVWFLIPSLLIHFMPWLKLEDLFYIALAISLLAGLSGFYRKRPAGIVFSMASEMAILAYILYASNGGFISLEVMGFHATVDVTNLIMVLILPLVISLVAKVWKLATLEAEKRVKMVEEG